MKHFILLTVASVSLLFLLGCTTGNDMTTSAKKSKSPTKYSILADSKNGGQIVDGGSIETDIIQTSTPKNEVALEVTDIQDKLTTIVGKATHKDSDELFKKLFPEFDKTSSDYIKVAINFDAASLGDVIPAFATPLKLNYVLDPDVDGTITMSLKSNMTPREVWNLFEQILRIAGAYCEMENQVIHIRPISKIQRENKFFQKDSNIEVQVVPLKYVSAKELATQLKPFLSDAANVGALDSQRSLIIVENSKNISRILNLIEQLDRKAKTGWHKAVFICRNVPAVQIQKELMELLPILGFAVTENKNNVETGEIAIVCLDRVQAIVATAVTPEPLKEIQKWIKILDKTNIGEQEQVFLYEVINGKADELLSAISVIFPVESTTLTSSSSGKSASATSNIGKIGSSKNSDTSSKSPSGSATKSSINNSRDKKTEVANSIYDTPVRIFADAVHNRLLIRTTPRTYAMIRAILKRLDTIPSQILMQILVVEIELSDSNEFGMEFSMSSGSGNHQSIFGTNFETLSPNTTKVGQTGGTFTIYNPKNPDQKFGYIRALASKNNLRVLSSPQIVAKSHSQAKISVGKRVPIITNEITDTQSTVINDTSLRRSYQYEDTGIILTVTPQVTKGGLISMSLEQIISDAVENDIRGMESPVIKEDVLSTELAIRDGRTLIMGGLIKEKQNETISSLPFIIDIPFIRNLFGDTNKTRERTEILVLITATIIKENSNLEEMIQRYKQAVAEIKQFESRQYSDQDDSSSDKTELQEEKCTK